MRHHDTMIRVSRFVATLLAAGLLAAPATAAADGIMLVPAGAFWMGRDDGAADEAPLHRVYVRDFWIERHNPAPSDATTRTTPTRACTCGPAAGSPTRASSTIRPARARSSAPGTTARGSAAACPPKTNGRRQPVASCATSEDLGEMAPGR